jgi:hypothetical protein
MRITKQCSLRACTLAVCILLSSPTIQAADLYVNAEFGISLGIGTNDVSNSIDPGTPKSTESEDAAPVIGTGFGLAMPLYEIFPWSMSIPRVEIPIWPGKALTMGGQEHWTFPDWDTRFELAYIGAQEHDLRTRSGPPGGLGTTYFTTSSTHSLMATTRLEVPIQAPLNALFGRLPILDPLTMYGGGGVGVAFTELKTVARDDRAKEEGINFAYQFGAGFGYAMSDALHLSLGWRYVNFGVTEADLIDTVGNQIGKVESDVGAHEFTMGFRYAFWRVPLFDDRD